MAPRAQESLSEQSGSPVLGETERLTEVPAHSRLMVTVEEEPFTLSDLEALPQTQISAAGETYEGVAIHDLLAAAQITDVLTITLVARDPRGGPIPDVAATWVSSDPTVATCSGGTVMGISPGSANSSQSLLR